MNQAKLKTLVSYDPETGIFIRLVRMGQRGKIGDILDTRDKDGYLVTKLEGQTYRLSRLAFIYMLDEAPIYTDHENLIRDDNRWSNLRAASCQNNAWNRSVRRDSRSGIKGVIPLDSGRWLAQLTFDGRNRHLATFDDCDEAAEFVQLARDMAHGSFACHG